MTRIAVTGLPFFAPKAAAGLRKCGFNAVHLRRPSRSLLWLPQFALELARCGAIYSVGSSAARGSPNDRLRILGKKIVMHWVGSDVLAARDDRAAGRLSEPLIACATHWADAPWLVDELSELGIAAAEHPLPISIAIGQPEPLPPDFRVLVYLPAGDRRAHDFEGTLSVIRALPEIQFVAAGARRVDAPIANLEMRGFVDDMPSLYRECSAILRLTHHDGLSHSVIEAISFGRYALWTFPLPGSILIDSSEAAIEALRELKRKADSRALGVNQSGAQEVTERYSEPTIADELRKAMRRALAEHGARDL